MRVKIMSYKSINDGELMTSACRVVEKMKQNAAFPNPPTALAELEKIIPKYRKALAGSRSGDREMISLKNDCKAAIQKLLTKLADYVTITADGDETKLISSGFEVRQHRVTTTPPSVKTLQVNIDKDGEATTCITKIAGARAYMHQYTTEMPKSGTLWVSEGSSYRSFTFKHLQSEKRYWFRVVAIGSGGNNAYSDVVSKVIQ